MRFVWDAFWTLTTDRQVGFATGPIPWTAIDRYADRHRLIAVDSFERFHALIRAMDSTYLEHLERELEKARRDKPANGNA